MTTKIVLLKPTRFAKSKQTLPAKTQLDVEDDLAKDLDAQGAAIIIGEKKSDGGTSVGEVGAKAPSEGGVDGERKGGSDNPPKRSRRSPL